MYSDKAPFNQIIKLEARMNRMSLIFTAQESKELHLLQDRMV